MEKNENHITRQALFPMAATVFLCLAVHGYRFANTMLSHDALLEVVQADAAWQIALGRFFQPVLVFLRGDLCSPWTLCLLQTFWLAVSVFLLTDLLEIRYRPTVVAVAGIVVSSDVFIILNASFLPWSDLFAFSLFAAVFGVWCLEKGKLLYALSGVFSMTVSLATYQAYISVSLTLVLLLIILRLCSFETDLKSILKRALYYGAALLTSAILYYASWQIIRNGLGIWAADTYNGMANLGRYGQGGILASVLAAYHNVFTYFTEPAVMSNLSFRGMQLGNLWKYLLVAVNICVVIVILSGVFRICHTQRLRYKPRTAQLGLRYLLLALSLLLFPLACNFVGVVFQGEEHTLMLFGPTMFYVFAIAAEEKASCLAGDEHTPKKQTSLCWTMTTVKAAVFLLSIVIWVRFLYAGQVYFKKSLQEKAAYSLLTRIVADVEKMPGYVPGVTPVAISGYFERSSYLTELPGFEDLKPYAMGKTSLTYQGTDYAMLTFYIGVNMNLTRVDPSLEAVQKMPLYPAAESISEIDGTIVVKISD